MRTASTQYRLVLPEPWERIPLAGDTAGQVRAIIDRRVARLPKEVPPDQVGPVRRRLEDELGRHLADARENGGVDFYLPTDLVHGIPLNASFVVSAMLPDTSAESGLAPRVLASLLSEEGAEPVEAGGSTWVRRERRLQRPADTFVDAEVAVRKVEYLTPVPDDELRWILVTFTTVGDGDPDGDLTGLVVELFDAIMSTWRWVPPEPSGEEGPAGRRGQR